MKLRALIAIVVFVIFGLAPLAQAQDAGPDDEVTRSQGEVIAIDRGTAGVVDVAVVVTDVPAGETPTVQIVGDMAVTSVAVEALDSPPTVVVAFDTSGSMAGSRIELAKAAAETCIALLPPNSELGLIAFSSSVTASITPSTDSDAVVNAIQQLTVEGETATFDAIVWSTLIAGVTTSQDTLDERASRFIILLTDGEDTVSTSSADDAQEALERTGFRLYALGVDPSGEEFESLNDLTEASGGLLLTGTAAELGGLCASLADRIDSRFRVSVTTDGDTSGAFDIELGFTSTQSTVRVPAEKLADAQPPREPEPEPEPQPVATDPIVDPPSEADADSDAPSVDDTAVAAPPAAPTTGPTPLPALDGPVAEPSTVRLWLGAALAVAAPMVLLKTTTARRRLPLGLRIRSLPRVGPVARLSVIASRLLERNRRDRVIDRQLEMAALRLRAGEFIVFTALASLLPALALVLLGIRVSALVVLVGVPVVAWKWVKRRGRKRSEAFQAQLGDTVVMLAGALRSGNSTVQALSAVADKAPNPTAEEFKRVMTESRIGRDLSASLESLAERMGSDDARWVVESISLNRELGGNLAATLDNVGETIRARAEIKSQVRIMSAEGRMTAGLLLFLPIGMAGFLQLINPGFLAPLYTTGLGVALLVAVICNMSLGAFWISRLIKMEY